MTIGPRRVLGVIHRAGLKGTGVCLCRPAKTVSLKQPNGLATKADLYGLDGPRGRPGVIIVHGNTVHGRRLPIYKVLATGLAARGMVVLAYDEPGFGESENPFDYIDHRTADPFDGLAMARAAVEYLTGLEAVDGRNLTVIGHSRGSSTAVRAALDRSEIKRIALIGPPRRVAARFQDGAEIDYVYRRLLATHRFVYGRPMPEEYRRALDRTRIYRPLTQVMAAFFQTGHKPLFLIDGAAEPEMDRQYLTRFFESLPPPRSFLRLKNADHYNTTAQSLGLVVFDEQVNRQLVESLTGWIGK